MKKKDIILTAFLSVLILFIIVDRYLWMPERVKYCWNWDSGILLGDPICEEEDYEVNGSEIIIKKFVEVDGFKNTNRKVTKRYYLAGCYFGRLYIYDPVSKKMTAYTDD